MLNKSGSKETFITAHATDGENESDPNFLIFHLPSTVLLCVPLVIGSVPNRASCHLPNMPACHLPVGPSDSVVGLKWGVQTLECVGHLLDF